MGVAPPKSYQKRHSKTVFGEVVAVKQWFVCQGWLLFGFVSSYSDADGISDQPEALLL